MKIIFLDMDGVLNITGPSYNSHNYRKLGDGPVEEILIKRLEFIISRAKQDNKDLGIVISSSWDYKQTIRVLYNARFTYVVDIIGSIPRDENARDKQILAWLKGNTRITKDDKFVILEDKSNYIYEDNPMLNSRIVNVNTTEGLSNKNAIAAVKMLTSYNNVNDGDVVDSTVENFMRYWKMGFKPNMNINVNRLLSVDVLVDKWKHIKLNTKSLSMIMLDGI